MWRRYIDVLRTALMSKQLSPDALVRRVARCQVALDSTAVAGEGLDIPGSFDLAAVFGDGFDTFPAATGGNFLVEILPMLF